MNDLAIPQTESWSYLEALNPLLTTNDPPNPSEEVLARAEIARAQQQLDILQNAGVLKVQQMLDSLQESRQRVNTFVEDHRRIMSPLRRASLPSEVLAEIFRFIADDLRLEASVNNKDGMWTIARVCRYWRRVSLSLPSLWSRILIQSNSVPSVVELLLSRSEGATLDVRIWGLRSQSDNEEPRRAIFAVSHRWRIVHIYTCASEHLFLQIKGRVPLLEFLHLYRTPFSPFTCFSEAPSLRTLVIDNLYDFVDHSLAISQFPWSQLRECHLPFSSSLEQFSVLQLCSNIEVLHIVGNYKQSDPSPMPTDILSMPKLQKLTFVRNNELLNHLILPSLDCFTLKYCQQWEWDDQCVERIRQSLERSSVRLNGLGFESGDLICVVQLLREVPLPDLTILSLNCDMSTDFAEFLELLTALTIDANSTQCILPRLQKLRIHSTGCYRIYDEEDLLCIKEQFSSLIAMVRSRRKSETTSQLTRLELDLRLPQTSSLSGGLEPLLSLRDQGLRLEMDSFFLYPDNGDLDGPKLGSSTVSDTD